MPKSKAYPHTPDGRYFVAKNRLWRCTDPALPEEARKAWVKTLMTARRGIHLDRDDPEKVAAHRREVHAAKIALGERGPVWWTDGAPDENQCAPAKSSYADWWKTLPANQRQAGL